MNWDEKRDGMWGPDGGPHSEARIQDRPTQPREGYVFLHAKRCSGPTCGSTVYWWRTLAGRPSPHDRDGISHFATCPDSQSFRKGSRT